MDYFSEKARQITPYVAGVQPSEAGWVKLNANENPYPPSQKVTDAISNFCTNELCKYPNSGCDSLRQAIATVLDVDAKNVFCGNGSDEVLALAYQAFFSGKDNIQTPDISYTFYPVWAQMYDVIAKNVPVAQDFSINPEDYINANGVILANPNAPTAQVLELDAIEQIVKNNPNGVVIIDEAYIDFTSAQSAIPLTKKYENLLVVRTFSKSYSLAGLRVGFAVGSDVLMDGLNRLKNAFNPYPLGALEQVAATAAILDTEYLAKVTSKIMATRDNIINQLRDVKHLNLVPDSHTNFFLMKTGNAQDLFAHITKHKFLIRYWQKPRISEYLRVSVGTDEDMRRFVECVKAYK